LGVAVFWLLLWALAASGVGQSLLLPSPWPVIQTLARLMGSGAFWQAVAASMLRTVEAFAWGVCLGAMLAVWSAALPALRKLLHPALLVIRAMPVASFIILSLVWLRGDRVPVLAGAVMVLPIVWGNVSQGISGVDPRLIEMARMYDFSPLRRVSKLYMPSVLPTFLAACETSMGLCWKATSRPRCWDSRADRSEHSCITQKSTWKPRRCSHGR
jgi:NitT/TauT family transport system permease protein